MSDTFTVGPVQMLVVGFDDPQLTGEILPELKRLRAQGVIRLIDLLFVTKDESGELVSLQQTDLTPEEAEAFGALVGALVGFGAGGEDAALRAADAGAAELADGHVFDDSDVWYVGDAIPNGSSAAIALIEHRWAIPLRDAIGRAGGVALADEWIHPADLIAVGMAAAASHEPA